MLVRVLVALIELYQVTLSRLLVVLLGPVCRFDPSCSRYAVACLRTHGLLRGGLLSLARLCKCHPFHPGGYDPPPGPACLTATEGAATAMVGGCAGGSGEVG